ncbi:MAG: Fe-S cluster assembly protein SufD [Prevotella sp.]|nr:Fe-S cluster assembly protein SufD [Prevotella sp.]
MLLNACRDEAYASFLRGGLPSRKEERYRYTDMQGLFAPDYGVNINRLPVPIDPYKTFRCFVPNLNSLLYFVVNDTFCPPSEPRTTLPDGVIVGSLKKIAETNLQVVRDYYNRLANNDDAVSSLNTMFVQDGVFIYVPRGVRVEQPVQIVNMLHSGVDMMANRRVLIVLEADSSLNILFCDHTDSNTQFLSTQVAEIFIGENAALDLTSVEETHSENRLASNTFIRLAERSRLCHNVITLHNGTTRNSLNILLDGEGAECVVNGSVILDKRQHADNNTLITHAAPHCSSRELYKYVVGDAATGAFAGKVLVARGAQKTDSEMRNQNLCATKEARMYTQPMLEIYADDVKCSHGATVGQLNDAALFYMQQRGIPVSEAKRLLQIAFMSEVIDNIRLTPLRERLRYLVEKRFRGELNTCEGCTLCK